MEKTDQLNDETRVYLAPEELYGPAIDAIQYKADGTMWATNDEYSTRINFNPFTGEPAKNQMVGVDKVFTRHGEASSMGYIDYR